MSFAKIVKHPIRSFKNFLKRFYFCFLSSKIVSDKISIKAKYKAVFHKKLDLENPQTFNEKLNWMKLYYRFPTLTNLVDKHEVKLIVSNLIGADFVIPEIGVYDNWGDVNFDKIAEPFVIKTTHSSGVIVLVNDKSAINWRSIKKKIKKSLRHNYFYRNREWPYKDIKPRILIEKLIKDPVEVNLPVFKFFCFSGEPFIVQTIKNDKTSYETIDYFDMGWNRLELSQNFANSDIPLPKPSNFEEMKRIAKKLAGTHPFIRVDLYSVGGKIYFSEYTFFSDAGYTKFHPENWDLLLGEKIILPLNGTDH